jgi:hypothetical protein
MWVEALRDSTEWTRMKEDIEVIAYSGYQGEQEPRALIYEKERLDVLGIADRWYDPKGSYFKVRASDGAQYLLRCDAESRAWTLVKRWVLDG